jgi:hypothetical protein
MNNVYGGEDGEKGTSRRRPRRSLEQLFPIDGHVKTDLALRGGHLAPAAAAC